MVDVDVDDAVLTMLSSDVCSVCACSAAFWHKHCMCPSVCVQASLLKECAKQCAVVWLVLPVRVPVQTLHDIPMWSSQEAGLLLSYGWEAGAVCEAEFSLCTPTSSQSCSRQHTDHGWLGAPHMIGSASHQSQVWSFGTADEGASTVPAMAAPSWLRRDQCMVAVGHEVDKPADAGQCLQTNQFIYCWPYCVWNRTVCREVGRVCRNP